MMELVAKWLKVGVLGAGLWFMSVPAQAADITKGANLYHKYCATCHGENGIATMPGAPNFSPVSRAILRPDQFIMNSIRDGKGSMPSFQGVLEQAEMFDLIAYIRTLNN